MYKHNRYHSPSLQSSTKMADLPTLCKYGTNTIVQTMTEVNQNNDKISSITSKKGCTIFSHMVQVLLLRGK